MRAEEGASNWLAPSKISKQEFFALSNDYANNLEQNKQFKSGSCRGVLNRFFFQTYNDVEALIETLTIMTALVATLGVTMVTIIDQREFPYGTVKVLAMHHRGFRCHFAPEEALDVCKGFIDCNVDYDAKDYLNIRHDVCNMRCDKDNILAGYNIARQVSVGEVKRWVEANYHNIPYPAFPSKDIAHNGFFAVFCLMTSLFISVMLYNSLLLSQARNNPMELARWWNPFGALSVFCCYGMLLMGAFYFLQSLEMVIATRFQFYVESSCFTIWNRNLTFSMLSVLLLLLLHHLHTRLPIGGMAARRKLQYTFRATESKNNEKKIQKDKIAAAAEPSKVPTVFPSLRKYLKASSEDMSHVVPIFEQSRITQSQIETLKKEDLISMGICVGDALRTIELIHSFKKQRRNSLITPQLSGEPSPAKSARVGTARNRILGRKSVFLPPLVGKRE